VIPASDVLAIATHGRGGLARWAIGSVAVRVFEGSRVPLLVIRPAELVRREQPAESDELELAPLPHTAPLRAAMGLRRSCAASVMNSSFRSSAWRNAHIVSEPVARGGRPSWRADGGSSTTSDGIMAAPALISRLSAAHRHGFTAGSNRRGRRIQRMRRGGIFPAACPA